tara:strand:- start:526 stop:1422 length:897 start_codon:yes stop_codon:yes gene_type:complete
MDIDYLRKKYEIDGYVILKNYFEENNLKNITRISEEILDKAKKGKWQHVRIYRDYPNFFDNLNIFGVDYPLNFNLNKSTFYEFKKLEYKETILNLLGWKNFYTPLIRLHSNSSFYNYQGEWHRDDPKFPSDNSIQIIIYLLDEKGYRIVPKSKNHVLEKYGILKDQARTPGRGFAKLSKDMYDIIEVKRGDILIHQSGLLHQGFCKKKRLHYHIRHIRDDNAPQNPNNFLNIDEKFFGEYDVMKIKSNTYEDVNNKSFKIKLKRLKTFLFYFFPRIKSILNNLKNKNKETIFHSTIWQ